MITFIEGGDVNTLRARHVTHVGVMTSHNDTDSSLVILHDVQRELAIHYAFPQIQSRQTKLIDGVIK